ncbi:DUF2851 family protein [Lutibacter sp. HS1-25]|uniref:DUF2851 family protein n=1 Tax=Lutibacter sp. HS1-25 TaxID=2485000 RepID=UPI001010D2BC|nr:DUF2851 family protein [Lutibacter sp. HS1-25]RXP63548.1 DUF2851 family protein [Lutibacter sp. HS1-25]
MKENLLHFIWKLQLFSSNKLQCTKNKSIYIIAAGLHNLNSGPDFLNAKIEIDGQLWAGNVEIHINSSDWYAHNHEMDENYDSVILHVVWEHDVAVFNKSNMALPTLELKNIISKKVLENYNDLFNKNKKWLFCESSISSIDNFKLSHWYERLYFERLEQKSERINQLLEITKNNWEAVLFILLAKNFGLKINGEAFNDIASSFDFSIVRKLANDPAQLEALLFGQASLLQENVESEYFKKLKYNYEYLQVKFQLKPIAKGQIQFFRLRPPNFPTIRLSQLALLYHLQQNLFSKIIEVKAIDDFYSLFNVSTSTFWETHYTFGKESKKSIKKLSKSFVDLLLINTILPIKFMYLKKMGETDFSDLLTVLEHIKPEKNTIISNFNELKIKSKSAFETQALLQLKNEYCNNQLCLECEIGKELLER